MEIDLSTRVADVASYSLYLLVSVNINKKIEFVPKQSHVIIPLYHKTFHHLYLESSKINVCHSRKENQVFFIKTTSHADPNVSRLGAPFKDVHEEIDLQNKFTLI